MTEEEFSSARLMMESTQWWSRKSQEKRFQQKFGKICLTLFVAFEQNGIEKIIIEKDQINEIEFLLDLYKITLTK